jgi:hypothetical protein
VGFTIGTFEFDYPTATGANADPLFLKAQDHKSRGKSGIAKVGGPS